jgi:PAS domain S-box-containing protein
MKLALPRSTPHPSESDSPQREVRRTVSRHFFGTAAAVALLVALLFVVLSAGLSSGARTLLVLAFGALAALAALSMRARGPRVVDMIHVLAVVAIAIVALSTVVLEWGVSAPGIGFFGLLTCTVGAVSGLRAGAAVAALSGATVIGLGCAQYFGWMSVAGLPLPPENLLLRVLINLFVVLGGLAAGAAMSRVVSRYLRTTKEREQRFRGLLAIAADAYWEIDEHYRLVAFKRQAHDPGAPGEGDIDGIGIGQVPWELPGFEIDDDTLDLLQAHLEAREAFRDLPVQWRTASGEAHHFLISGEPRHPVQEAFHGYWGVARNISTDVYARQALQATEIRYQELFTRIPTPLVLHVDSRIIDANPSALALFGYQDLKSIIDQDLLGAYESGDSRERARRRLESLQEMQIGEALPVMEYRLVSRQGRRIVARATGVRVEASGEAAVLSIFVDDTERKNAEDAVRRSEAMLSHLVATSPDVITLTDLQTGRYAMVNKTFERQTGYSAAEVVGRTSSDIGIWRRREDSERFIAAIRDKGQVQDVATEFVTKAGASLSMLVSGTRFDMDRREYLVINARDVTETERARLEREAILQNASVGIAVTRDQRFVLANPRFEQMYGWPSGALIGQSGRAVWNSDDDYREVGALLGPALARGEAAEIETVARRFDGGTFLAKVSGKAIDPDHPSKGGTIWIVEDVTEQRNVENALARARDAAEAANRAKSAFLANTSHELRTPLHGLIGLAGLAREPNVGAAERAQYLLQIGDAATSLSAIISDILDVSKIEAGRIELEDVVFDLGELLRLLQRTNAALVDPGRIALRLQVGAGVDGMVRGDPLRTRQIINNFVGNALKFTASGEVRVVVQRLDAQRVRFEVHDTGPGLDDDIKARLFKPFTQADESTTRRYGGTGLGLSISRELAVLMGGEVGVDSALGHGSCFWAELPLPTTQALAAADPPDASLDQALHGAWVLMVEDNPVNMVIAVAQLEQWGVHVEQASDGQQAVAAVQACATQGRLFDAVLMDVQMPVMSGYEATRALRQRHSASELPIIALTAAALVGERDEALAAGMNDFLTKPIEPRRLRATLARWVARRAGTSADKTS